MVLHEGRHEEIAVVVAILQPELAGLAARGHRLGERLGLQQVEELVVGALVDQDRAVEAAFAHQERRIVLLPGGLVLAEIGLELLAAPVAGGRVRDGGEGRDGPEPARQAHRQR